MRRSERREPRQASTRRFGWWGPGDASLPPLRGPAVKRDVLQWGRRVRKGAPPEREMESLVSWGHGQVAVAGPRRRAGKHR